MSRNKRTGYDDVVGKFLPDRLSEEAFKSLNKTEFWEDFRDAAWMSSESPALKTTYEELKTAIILYSKQLDIKWKGSSEQHDKILSIYPKMVNDIELYRVVLRKKIRKSNIKFFVSFILLSPIVSVVILAFSSRSFQPSDWYDELIRLLNVGVTIIKILVAMGLTLGLFFLSALAVEHAYKALRKNKESQYEHERPGILMFATFILAGISIIVVFNGVKETFGVDLFPYMGGS